MLCYRTVPYSLARRLPLRPTKHMLVPFLNQAIDSSHVSLCAPPGRPLSFLAPRSQLKCVDGQPKLGLSFSTRTFVSPFPSTIQTCRFRLWPPRRAEGKRSKRPNNRVTNPGLCMLVVIIQSKCPPSTGASNLLSALDRSRWAQYSQSFRLDRGQAP